MSSNERLSERPTRKRRVRTRYLVGLAAVVLVGSLFAGYTRWSSVTGFGGTTVTKETTRYADASQAKEAGFDRTVEKQNPRTLWDWIGLVGVGSAVVLVGYVFARKQRERDEVLADVRAQEETLQGYLDRMSSLIVDQKLGEKHEDSVAKVAQARTIATLLALDTDHKRRPLKLIYELGLIKKDGPLITLKNASLGRAALGELALPDTCLSGVDLRATDLSGSNLSGADLSGADLRGADLSNADLSNADLSNANLLPYDERHPAKLSIHNLKDEDAGPSHTELRFGKAKPYLTPANLSNTNLEKANLSGAILGSTDLRSARGLEQEQFERAIGNRATKLPGGLEPHEAWKSKSMEQQIEASNKQ